MTADEVRMNLLVVSPSWIGDVIIALPAVQNLREQYRRVHLVVLAKPAVAPLWEMTRLADDIVLQEPGTSGVFASANRLRSLGIDQAYIIPNSFRSALIVFLSRARRRIGFARHWRKAMLTDVVQRKAELGREHQVYEIIDLFGADSNSVPEYPRIQIEQSLRTDAAKRFGLAAGAIGIIPGAARGPSKCWPAEHYIALGKMLAKDGYRLAIFGGGGEVDLCRQIGEQIGGSAVCLAGKTDLQEWAALLSSCAGVVANDSGGMHLAAALGCPLVAVFGITDPDKTGPRGRLCRVIRRDVPSDRDIPRESRLARKCLESIEPEAVYSALRELVTAYGNQER